jgi:hypothetical protein
MFEPRCPKCGSPKVSQGYLRTPLLLRLFGYYGLLCHNCNLSYKGFAVPGTVRSYGEVVRGKHKRRGKRRR